MNEKQAKRLRRAQRAFVLALAELKKDLPMHKPGEHAAGLATQVADAWPALNYHQRGVVGAEVRGHAHLPVVDALAYPKARRVVGSLRYSRPYNLPRAAQLAHGFVTGGAS